MTTSKKRLALILLAALIILLSLIGIFMMLPPSPQISPPTSLQTYTLTITHTTGGTTNPAPGNHTYPEDTIVTVNATPSTGYVFNHWELDGSEVAGAPSIHVTMDANHTVHAVFKPLYTLTITSTAGGTTDPAPGSYQFVEGTIINVTANPEENFIFGRWELDGVNQGTPNPIAVTMNAKHTLHAVFKLPPPKYYLTVISPYGMPGGSGWYNANDTAYATLDTSIVDHGNGTRRVFTHWSGDASGTYYKTSDPILMDENKTAVANWKTEYYLTVTSPHDTPIPTSGWFEAGTVINASVTSPWPGATGTRYVCTGWTGTGSVPPSESGTTVTFTINVPSTITWTWKTQYYLTVSSTHGTAGGSGWYNVNDLAYATVTPLTVAGSTGIRYVFTQWSGDASGNTSPSNPITMNGPKTAVANWKTQYYLTVDTDPTGLSSAPTPSSGWYNESINVQLTAPDPNYKGFVEYSFKYWDVDGSNVSGNPITVHMDGPHTVTAHYQKPPPLPVGGYALPIDKLYSPAQTIGLPPRIGLAFALLAAMAATILLARRKSKTLK